ncbi:hypothetical protein [Pseudoalteromonas piscicida]|uniref:hypothetical protein n=1 Tax=Pseudoalteromonas piscicida TaxID=43662 RepID=UPI0005F9D37A|nr:hypothetical protein [Pseudoalteromonas piscicida]KJY96740.1 hypothetical protein TW73_16015 [Pseudoalteromonas piscicida]
MTSKSIIIAAMLFSGVSANAQANSVPFSDAEMTVSDKGYTLSIAPLQFEGNRHLSIELEVSGVKTISRQSISACTYLQADVCTGATREVNHTEAEFEAQVALRCDDNVLFDITSHDSEFTNENVVADIANIRVEQSVFRENLSSCESLTLNVNLAKGDRVSTVLGSYTVSDSTSN